MNKKAVIIEMTAFFYLVQKDIISLPAGHGFR